MIYGKLSNPSTYLALAGHPVWSEAFESLSQLNANAELGTTPLRGDLMFLNVHTYESKPVEQCRFEGHRDMIDVQYMIQGGELIEWVLKSDLEEDGSYLPERDFQYYHRPAAPVPTRVHLAPGHFGIFFPADGHCPKIHDGTHDSVLKAVVKIHCSLFA